MHTCFIHKWDHPKVQNISIRICKICSRSEIKHGKKWVVIKRSFQQPQQPIPIKNNNNAEVELKNDTQ